MENRLTIDLSDDNIKKYNELSNYFLVTSTIISANNLIQGSRLLCHICYKKENNILFTRIEWGVDIMTFSVSRDELKKIKYCGGLESLIKSDCISINPTIIFALLGIISKHMRKHFQTVQISHGTDTIPPDIAVFV